MDTKCDPELQKELDRINTELDLEDAMENASDIMEIREKFEQSQIRGIEYAHGYYDAWWESANYYEKHRAERMKSIEQKYNELRKRWWL